MKNIKKRLIGWTLGLALSLGVGIGIASNAHSEIARVEAASKVVTVTSAAKIDDGAITATFEKGSGSTAPTWYKEGLRLYAKNTITVASKSDSNISKIVFNWEKQGSKPFASVTSNVTNYAHPSSDGEGVWTGSSKSVVFTLGGNGQLQLNTFSYEMESTVVLTAKSVTINPSELKVTEGKIGYTKQLSAVVEYNESTQTDSRVLWSSSNENAAVSKEGLLTLKTASGQAVITATSVALASDGNQISNSINVTWSGLIEPHSIVFSEKGYSNSQKISEADINSTTKVIFNKGTNENNSPVYYNTGAAVRVYGGNTFKIILNDTSKRLASITLAFAKGEDTNAITTDKGNFNSPTWLGNAQDVTFSVDGTSGHRRIVSITVTYEDFADTSATDALAFGTSFLSKTATACTDGTKDNSEALKTAWTALTNEFSALSDGAKKLVKDAAANNAGTDLEKAMARYDHIVKRYSAIHTEINDFIGRGVTASLTNQLFKANTTNNIMVISLIACASAAAIGSFFFIRKRKEQN